VATDHPIRKDPLMTPEEAAEYMGLSTQTLAQLRFRGSGPIYYKPSTRTVVYKKSDLDKYFESTKQDKELAA